MADQERFELNIAIGAASFNASGDAERVMAALEKFSDLVVQVPDSLAGVDAEDAPDAAVEPRQSNGKTSSVATTITAPTTTTTRKRTRAPFRGTRVEELEEKFTPDVRTKLEAYVTERQANFKEATDQAAILASFLDSELAWPAVSADDLYTIYTVMGWPAPNPRNALSNAKNRKGYFSGQREGKYPLTHTGERFGRHDSKAAAASE